MITRATGGRDTPGRFGIGRVADDLLRKVSGISEEHRLLIRTEKRVITALRGDERQDSTAHQMRKSVGRIPLPTLDAVERKCHPA